MKQFDSRGNEVVLGLLTKEIILEHNPKFTNAMVQDCLSKFKYYNKLNPNYIYSEHYVEKNNWEIPPGSKTL